MSVALVLPSLISTTGGTFTGQINLIAGTAAAPSFTLGGEQTGMYLNSTGYLGFTALGVGLMYMGKLGNNVQIGNAIGVAAANGFVFYAANNALALSVDASAGTVVRSGGLSVSFLGAAPPGGGILYDGLTGGSNGANAQLKAATTTTGALTSGATKTLTGLIPAGSLVSGIVTRVTTLITGATSYSVGDTVNAIAYGSTLAVAAGTTSNIANFTLAGPQFYPAATDVIITANGSNFTAGNIRVTVYYTSLTAPTS